MRIGVSRELFAKDRTEPPGGQQQAGEHEPAPREAAHPQGRPDAVALSGSGKNGERSEDVGRAGEPGERGGGGEDDIEAYDGRGGLPGPDGRQEGSGDDGGQRGERLNDEGQQLPRRQTEGGAQQHHERDGGQGQDEQLHDEGQELAGDDLASGQRRGEQVLQGSGRLVGEGAGGEGGGGEQQDDELLPDEPGEAPGEEAGRFFRADRLAGQPGKEGMGPAEGEDEEHACFDAQRQRVGEAKAVVGAAAGGAKKLPGEDRAEHRTSSFRAIRFRPRG